MAAARVLCRSALKPCFYGRVFQDFKPRNPWRGFLSGRPDKMQKWSFQRNSLKIPSELQPAMRKWRELVRGASQQWRRSSFRQFSGGGGGYGNPGQAVLYVIGANVAVFIMWKVVDPRIMQDHFTISLDNVLSGRLHTLFTNCVSHYDGWHLISNMIGLYFFGSEIAQWYGAKRFYLLYVVGGVTSGLGHLMYSYYVYPWLKGMRESRFVSRFVPPAMGASGSVNALVVLNILVNPKRIIFVDFFIPVPAALFGAYMIFKDLWGVRDVESSVAHVGHLGGALVGAIAWFRWRRMW